jgi:UDP-sugar transporter A1/2/3
MLPKVPENSLNFSRVGVASAEVIPKFVVRPQGGSSTFLRIGSCVALLFFSVGAKLFTEISKSSDGTYPYNSFMIPCTVEAVKLFVSTGLLLSSKMRGDIVVVSLAPSKFASYILPALCYFVSNNCMFYVIRELGPTTFQITNNLKVLATGVLMRIFLGRRMTWLRWKALMLLVLGSVVTQIQPGDSDNAESSKLGYILALVNSFAAGAGGVISEKLLKGTDNAVVDSIHWQNMQLYFFGLAFGLGSSISKMYASDGNGLFQGFNTCASATVVSLAMAGLLVSFVLKYLDNFAKCFVNALSIIFVALVYAAMQHEGLQLKLIVGIVLTCMALEQYNLPQ